MQPLRSILEAYSVIFVTTLPITFSITGRKYPKAAINSYNLTVFIGCLPTIAN